MRFLSDKGFPVPKPILSVPDHPSLGPFCVMKRVDAFPVFDEGGAFVRLARTLDRSARFHRELHQVDPTGWPLPADGSLVDRCLRALEEIIARSELRTHGVRAVGPLSGRPSGPRRSRVDPCRGGSTRPPHGLRRQRPDGRGRGNWSQSTGVKRRSATSTTTSSIVRTPSRVSRSWFRSRGGAMSSSGCSAVCPGCTLRATTGTGGSTRDGSATGRPSRPLSGPWPWPSPGTRSSRSAEVRGAARRPMVWTRCPGGF